MTIEETEKEVEIFKISHTEYVGYIHHLDDIGESSLLNMIVDHQ